MQFYFIRHAQSTNNALWESTGSSKGRSEDPELSEIGHRQAQHLAELLKTGHPNGGKCGLSPNPSGFGLTHLYSSLMLRAVMTGSYIAQALDIPLIAWIDLHEGGGIFLEDLETGEPLGLAGYNQTYFKTHFPDFVLPPTLGEAGWWNHRPFETAEESLVRAQRLLTELLERHGNSEDRVAVISHGAFYNDILRTVLDLPRRDNLWFRMNNTAITRIDFESDAVVIAYLNRTDHLPIELLT